MSFTVFEAELIFVRKCEDFEIILDLLIRLYILNKILKD